MRVAVLASGSGTILDAILSAGIPVEIVVVDRPCAATAVADRHGVPSALVERATFGPGFDRHDYTEQILKTLRASDVDLVVMAGFGTVLAPTLFDEYDGRVLNTHPALLPAFKGWRAVEAALEAGVKVTGCTVHFARLEVDDGPILAQEAVPVLPGDTVETLHERIKQVERRLYPAVLHELIDEER